MYTTVLHAVAPILHTLRIYSGGNASVNVRSVRKHGMVSTVHGEPFMLRSLTLSFVQFLPQHGSTRMIFGHHKSTAHAEWNPRSLVVFRLVCSGPNHVPHYAVSLYKIFINKRCGMPRVLTRFQQAACSSTTTPDYCRMQR